MKKIRVLMVAGAMDVGGIESQLMHLARNADQEKFQIDFTSTMPDALHRKEIEALGGKFIVIPRMSWKNPAKYCKALLKVMQEGQYDIVHSHELFHSGITLYLAYKAGVPCRFAHAHNWCDDDGSGAKPGWKRKAYNHIMQRLICRYSTVQIACSTWAGKFVFGEKAQKKASYHLVFNSVDTARFLDKFDCTETGEFCGSSWIHVLNVGRITAVKNQMFLTEIAQVFKEKNKQIRILCAGSGTEEYVEAVQSKIDENRLNDYIQLLGVRTDIDVLMRKCDAFVLPSKYEGMPLVMIEAQASGLPCVSASTYSPEVDFEIGTVVWLPLEAGAAVWAQAIEKAVTLGRADKESVEKAVQKKGFDSKLFAEKLCKLYEEDYLLRGSKND